MKVLILGSNGFVGTALSKKLIEKDSSLDIICSTRNDTNLFDLNSTKKLLINIKPDVLINAAARVGGIHANNTLRTEFILQNLKINTNVLESCINFPNIKIINLGSSCIYPANVKNPIKESSIMTGKLESTNSPYAMAKLAAIEIGNSLKQQYGHQVINLMPTNLYGPGDKFTEFESHVIPGLIYRMHNSKLQNDRSFNIWGSGKPLREFLYIDDLVDAISFIISNNINEEILNIGSGVEVSIKVLAEKIKKIIKYNGEIKFDQTMPDGIERKLLDTSILNSLGWKSKIDLDNGLKITYEWFKKNINF